MANPDDTDGAKAYLKDAQNCAVPDPNGDLNMSVIENTQDIKDLKVTTTDQGVQLKALILGEDTTLLSQVIYIMQDPDIAWWSKPALIRIARNQKRTSRYERRMKERELQGRYKFKNQWIDWDFTTEDVQRILYTLGKVVVGVSGGTAMFFTAQEFFGNLIKSGAVVRVLEKTFGL